MINSISKYMAGSCSTLYCGHMTPVVILASGRGSNARALMQFAQDNPKLVHVSGLISDRADAGALAIAEAFSVPSFVVDHKNDEEMLSLLSRLMPKWACLAGYMRLVSGNFLKFFSDKEHGYYRVLNVHPSLLPHYPGLNGYERAWKDKRKETGVTVHLVDHGLDTGRAILQEKFPILPGDSVEDVEKRGLVVEHRLYCEALKLAVTGKIAKGGGL